MAAHSSSRGLVPYSLLHNLSTVDLFCDERKKKRKTIGIFEAERVVARKNDREGIKYLIKWKGYSTFENTWEPEEHLAPASLRYFEEPNPPLDVVQSSVDRLRMAALDALSLRHKGPEQIISLEFRHDVFKYLFYGLGKPAEQKQWTLYEEKDFFRCKLPENWSCLYDCHGVKIRYPLKMRPFLGRSPKNHKKKGNNEIVALPQTYVEKMSVALIKIPSLCN